VSIFQSVFEQIDLKIVKKGEKIGIIKVPKSKREIVRKAGFFEDKHLPLFRILRETLFVKCAENQNSILNW